MDYVIPAWHALPIDSAVTIPQLDFDDAISNLHLLQNAKRDSGLIVTSYKPDLLTILNKESIIPQKIYSVFDLLQGINHYQARVLTYDDLTWPLDACFEFSPFHLNVYRNDRLYGRIIFDENARIIYADYMPNDGPNFRLVFDSRGFVSRKELQSEEGKPLQHIYYDESGQWRFKHSLIDDSVEINPLNNYLASSLKYAHLSDLLNEILKDQILSQLNRDDRLLVSLDDNSSVSQRIYMQYSTIFYVSAWNKIKNSYHELSNQPNFHCVLDSLDLANKLGAKSAPLISPFQTTFKLGHSQRQERQRILLFAENILDMNELTQLGENIYQRLMQAKGKDELYILSYSRAGYDRSQQVIQFLQNYHADEFQLIDPDDDDAKQELIEDQEKISLVIKAQQCTSNIEVLNMLDKTRLVIDWGKQPDNYLRFACVDVGVPRIQQVVTPEVKDHQNGLIVSELGEINNCLNYYLDSLSHWNQSLTYNIKVLNAHSGSQIMSKWDETWEKYHLGEDKK